MAGVSCPGCGSALEGSPVLCPVCSCVLDLHEPPVLPAPAPAPAADGDRCGCGLALPASSDRCDYCGQRRAADGLCLVAPWGELALPGTGALVLGRGADSPAAAELEPYANVSRRHLELRRLPDGSVQAVDLGSTNGSWLDEEPLRPGVPVAVPVGAELRLAAHLRLRLRAGSAS